MAAQHNARTARPVWVVVACASILTVSGFTADAARTATTAWSWDTDAEGFTTVNPQTLSTATWDATAGRIHIESNFRDPHDEMFVTDLADPVDDTLDFTLTGRFQAKERGKWQLAYAWFMAPEVALNNAAAAGVLQILYVSYSSGHAGLFFRFWDANANLDIDSRLRYDWNTEVAWTLAYDAGERSFRFTVDDAAGATLWDDTVALPAGESFTYNVAGAGARGRDPNLYPTPAAVVWVDDVSLTRPLPVEPPSAPLNLEAASGPDLGVVTLTWDAPAFDGNADVTAFTVYRDGAPVATLDGTARTFTATDLTPASHHAFAVTASNEAGESEPATACGIAFPWVDALGPCDADEGGVPDLGAPALGPSAP